MIIRHNYAKERSEALCHLLCLLRIYAIQTRFQYRTQGTRAKGQVERIKKAVLSLDAFPQSHQEENEGRYSGKGYRQLLIDNYIAIFRIDEPYKTVHVVTIQYQGRNL